MLVIVMKQIYRCKIPLQTCLVDLITTKVADRLLPGEGLSFREIIGGDWVQVMVAQHWRFFA